MSIPLTLGMPEPRDRAGLTDRLLLPRSGRPRGAHIGPRIVRASEFESSDGEVIVAVDQEPTRSDRIVRYHLDVPADQLGEALALPGPLAIFVADPDGESTRAIAAAGHSAGIAVSEPVGRIADFLAVIAHTDVGFVARAADGAAVVRILAATVAALRGDDIRTALAAPNVPALNALHPDAGAAVREVLLGIEIGDVDEATAYLVAAGLLD
ncbi:hypothetical protein [Antrihabitans cavernicola]|uniref:Uncharacterized protein n=1 Tax=Antrihabitans cavernicola TaxID=2495913 RepID=A0A5A7SJB6_9NOCA|nr:hypothetical protein [Spelaeibacter cavernicola]KAA0024723.1 hypothetical protein FOY51_01950 [Spelaeibacter cavernicola]